MCSKMVIVLMEETYLDHNYYSKIVVLDRLTNTLAYCTKVLIQKI
jgi:hypothetical protein